MMAPNSSVCLGPSPPSPPSHTQYWHPHCTAGVIVPAAQLRTSPPLPPSHSRCRRRPGTPIAIDPTVQLLPSQPHSRCPHNRYHRRRRTVATLPAGPAIPLRCLRRHARSNQCPPLNHQRVPVTKTAVPPLRASQRTRGCTHTSQEGRR